MSKDIKLINQYRPEIDGLRGLAVLAVIINHFNNGILQSGFLGVDIFFVISGFVITSSLCKKKYSNFFEFIGGFYSRRIRRILPSLTVYVILLSILICLFNPYPSNSLFYSERALLGISNITFFRTATDYFAETTALNPYTQTWSLGVEEQFYFIYPFLFWLTGLGSNKISGLRNLFWWLVGLFTFSLISFALIYNVNHSAAYFLMPFRFWEISAGALLFLSIKKRIKFIENFGKVRIDLISILIIFIFFLPKSLALFSTISIVFLTCILIYKLDKKSFTFRVLTSNYFLFLGKISYSLYLWHWGCLVLARWITGDKWWANLLAISISFVISILNFRYIETFFRYSTFKLSSIRSIASFLAYLLCLIFPEQFFFLRADKYREPFRVGLFQIGKNISPWKHDYYPLNAVNKSIKCDEKISDTKIMIKNENKLCFLINENSKKRIFVLGDSHSGNHVPSILNALSNQSENSSYRSILELRVNPFAGRTKNYWTNIREKDEKNVWDYTLSFLSKHLKPDDIVIFSTERDDIITIESKQQNLPRINDQFILKNLEIQLDKLSKITNKKNSKLFLVDDIPKACVDDQKYMIEILKKGNYSYCESPKLFSLKDRLGMTKVYKKLSSKNNVKYIDFHDELCPNKICGIISPVDKTLLYLDASPHFYYENELILSESWRKIFDENS
tara:strand:+ start:1377 stop:3410 length:2034 start_codon:yes stop_codon:yes gene_type:complete